MRLLLFALIACGGTDDEKGEKDADGDGWSYTEDCNDDDPAIHPGAEEICDGINNDCDPYLDENVLTRFWPDADGDGHGVPITPRDACEAPAGYAPTDDDCDDGDASVFPGATEACNGVDDNCDGVADDGVTTTWYDDGDGDGYGNPDQVSDDCVPPGAGWVTDGTDCDDADASVNPGEVEQCDHDDDNCDGRADQGVVGTWYSDDDDDGYGSPAVSELTCDPPVGWVQDDTDCRPDDPEVYPGATEGCNDHDDDCDGTVDEGFDEDGDGHTTLDCADGDDCDDADPEVYGGAWEVFDDGVDNDCDGIVDEAYTGTYSLASASVRFTAPAGYDAGRLVDIGDVTGDGIGDLVTATLYANSYAGGAYVNAGTVSGSGSFATYGWRLEGDPSFTYGAGRSIGVGDANGDGVEDIVVGAPYSGANRALVVMGPVTGDLSLTDADVVLQGDRDTYCSHGSDLGDIDGDSVADAVIGAYYTNSAGPGSGSVYVVYGPLSADVDLEDDADAILTGANPNSYAGRVTRAGVDMNGDGIGDFVATAPYDSTGAYYSGTVYLVYGPVSGDGSLSAADGIQVGESGSDYAGGAVALGDVGGDGLGDLVVGASSNSSSAIGGGAAYVVFGPASGTADLGSADIIVRGTRGAAYAGAGVAAGDTNGDGLGELLVGATGSAVTGEAWLFDGLSAGTYVETDAVAVFTGETAGSSAGTGVALGDLDGDDGADVAIGAPSLGGGGASYVQYAD